MHMHGAVHGAHMSHAHTKDLTRGNPYLLMLEFALPIFLSQLFQQLYNTADAFIVGKTLGTNALAAVTSSGTLCSRFRVTIFYSIPAIFRPWISWIRFRWNIRNTA